MEYSWGYCTLYVYICHSIESTYSTARAGRIYPRCSDTCGLGVQVQSTTVGMQLLERGKCKELVGDWMLSQL